MAEKSLKRLILTILWKSYVQKTEYFLIDILHEADAVLFTTEK